MLSPSLGLYYLLAGLCRILGKMYAVLLVWVYATSFQTLLDVEGDVCRLHCKFQITKIQEGSTLIYSTSKDYLKPQGFGFFENHLS